MVEWRFVSNRTRFTRYAWRDTATLKHVGTTKGFCSKHQNCNGVTVNHAITRKDPHCNLNSWTLPSPSYGTSSKKSCSAKSMEMMRCSLPLFVRLSTCVREKTHARKPDILHKWIILRAHVFKCPHASWAEQEFVAFFLLPAHDTVHPFSLSPHALCP